MSIFSKLVTAALVISTSCLPLDASAQNQAPTDKEQTITWLQVAFKKSGFKVSADLLKTVQTGNAVLSPTDLVAMVKLSELQAGELESALNSYQLHQDMPEILGKAKDMHIADSSLLANAHLLAVAFEKAAQNHPHQTDALAKHADLYHALAKTVDHEKKPSKHLQQQSDIMLALGLNAIIAGKDFQVIRDEITTKIMGKENLAPDTTNIQLESTQELHIAPQNEAIKK